MLNLDTQKPGCRTEVAQFEVCAEVILDALNGRFGLASDGDVVDKDRDDETHSVAQIDPDTVLADQARKSKLEQDLVQLLMPAATSLLEAIESLAEAPHPLGGLLLKSIRLSHVDLLLELAVEVGRGDVHRLEFEVLKRREGEDGSNRRPLGCRGKGFVVLEAWTLGEALGDEAALVSLDGAVRIALDLEYPAGANGFASFGELGEFPSAVHLVGLHLLVDRLEPLLRMRAG